MQLLLLSIVVICIAGSRTQEIANGTDYLRTHVNDSVPLEPALNAEIIEVPLPEPILINSETPTTSTDSTTTTLAPKTDDDNSPEQNDNDKTTISDHKYEAKISVDVHDILNLFKQQLQETEKRILAAIQSNQPSSPAPVLKSYRIADR